MLLKGKSWLSSQVLNCKRSGGFANCALVPLKIQPYRVHSEPDELA